MADNSKLHPATLVSNIKTCIPVTLDYDGTQYNNWSTLFQLHCRANLVIDHIIPLSPEDKSNISSSSNSSSSGTSKDDPLWQRIDDIVKQWIYGTISNHLLNSIINLDDKAVDTWNRLVDFFHNNKSARAVQLVSHEQQEVSSMDDSLDNPRSDTDEVAHRSPLDHGDRRRNSNQKYKYVSIDARIYKCIIEGEKDAISEMEVNRELKTFSSKEDKNSILHIAASAGQAQLIADRLIPESVDIIKWTNTKGDLAFHSAAKASHLESLKALMKWKEYGPVNHDPIEQVIGKLVALLGDQNDEGNTPLHIALENNQQEMSQVLVNEYCEAWCILNAKKISPLYMAIKSEFWEVVNIMISYIKKQDADSMLELLLQGKSVVHAAIDANNTEILKEIFTIHKDLIKLIDDGQSPVSYAAFKGHLEVVQYLVKKFPNYAYESDNEGSFPIHKAASQGNVKVIKELYITRNLLNRIGQSILHIAAMSGKHQVVSYLINIPELGRLINLKDEHGNTALHLAAKGFHPRVVYILSRERRCNLKLHNKDGVTALDYVEVHAGSFPTFEARLTWMALRYVNAPRSSQSARKYYKRKKSAGKEKNEANDAKELDNFKKRIDTHMLVATLVATVTFAAGFTLPGGYNQSNDDPNVGMAILSNKWAFKVFVICNTAALYSSILCVVTLIWAHLGDLKLILVSLKCAYLLLGFALVMMSSAFMMGMFVVLRTVPWLSYVVLGMGTVFLLGLLIFFIPLYNPSYIKNPVVRFFFSGTFLLLLLLCEKSSITYH